VSFNRIIERNVHTIYVRVCVFAFLETTKWRWHVYRPRLRVVSACLFRLICNLSPDSWC